MLLHRKVLLAVTVVVAGGSFYAALGYGAYLHSNYYRVNKERELVRFLELPASIGAVKPQNYYQADFLDIRVWLPGRRGEIFHCDRAEVHELPGQGGAFNLVIRDGRLTVDASRWRDSDYRRVLRSGLGHDFAALQLRRVDLFDVDLAWRHGQIGFAVRNATGCIQFDGPDGGRTVGEGCITVVSHTLNDTHTNEHIHVMARFRPSRDLVVHEVVFRLPPLPVKALGLEALVGVSEAHGQFEGRLRYVEQNGGPRVELGGRAEGIDLADWTAGLEGGPVHGKLDLTIDKAVITDQGPTAAKLNGRATDLRLAELTRVIGVTPIAGAAELEVLNAEFAEKRLVRMSLRGQVVDGSLEPLVALIGPGKVAGTFRLKVNALDLAGDEVVSADVDVEVVGPEDGPATIDTELIIAAARKLLGVELNPLIAAALKPFDKVTYSRFAFKLLADNGQLRILGSHGQGGRAILTVKVFGRHLAIVTQPDRPMELAPLIAKLRTSGEQRLRELIERYQAPPATAPGAP